MSHKIVLYCRQNMTGWVRATLAFATLRNLCIRGSRVKWRSAVHMDDGAGVAGLPTSAYE